MIYTIKSGAAGVFGGLCFFGVVSPTIVDNTTLIPVAAASTVVIAVAAGVWKIGRYFKGIEDALKAIQNKQEEQDNRISNTERAIAKIVNSRNWEMDTLRGDLMQTEREPTVFHSTVLIVDDDKFDRHLAHRKLKESGFTVLEADSLKEARAIMGSGRVIDCVLLDLKLPDSDNGAQTVADFIREFPSAVCLAFSGNENPDIKAAAIAAGADAFVSKADTADARYLVKMVAHAIERNKLKQQP